VEGARAIDPVSLRTHGPEHGEGILCIAGFGDDSTMFEPLVATDLCSSFRLVTVDLPGFGEEPQISGRSATLSDLADFVTAVATQASAESVLAHSAGSVVVGLAATAPGSTIRTVISLEGNLTKADAYYSGLAAEFDTPEGFRQALLARLDPASEVDPLVSRYRSRVAQADAHALWVLGNDVAAYSKRRPPGELLLEVSRVHYIYNPSNCAESSLAWLARSGLPATQLHGASHWPTLDAPERVAQAVTDVLA
jgi:pimeloyl-ACP methyl ester carboxylesterase